MNNKDTPKLIVSTSNRKLLENKKLMKAAYEVIKRYNKARTA